VTLERDGLTRRFGDIVALDSLSFTVPPGRVFDFLGPDGVAVGLGAVTWWERTSSVALCSNFSRAT